MNFELYKDRRKQWRWRLRASNGKILAVSSESYKHLTDCQNAVDLARRAHRAGIRQQGRRA